MATLKARGSDTLHDLHDRRPTNRALDAIFGSVEHEAEVGAGLLAGAVAFRFFLLLVPYVFVMVLGFGLSADVAGKDPQDLARTAGIAGLAATAIKAGTDASTVSRVLTFAIAVFALLSGAQNMVKALRAVHALIWRVPLVKLRRPKVAGLGFIGVLTFGLLLVRLITGLKHYSFITWVIATALFVVVPAGVWLVCALKLFPSAPAATWQDLWPGALLMGVGIQVLHIVTVLWIARSLESKSETYGSLGAALTILLWAYILGRLVTAGTSLNAVIWTNAHRGPTSG